MDLARPPRGGGEGGPEPVLPGEGRGGLAWCWGRQWRGALPGLPRGVQARPAAPLPSYFQVSGPDIWGGVYRGIASALDGVLPLGAVVNGASDRMQQRRRRLRAMGPQSAIAAVHLNRKLPPAAPYFLWKLGLLLKVY